MAKIVIPEFYYPSTLLTGSPGSVSARIVVTMNGTGDRLACVFNAPRTGDVTGIVFATGTVTTPQSLDARLETVAATGHPSGTLATAGATVSEASPATNTLYDLTLGTPHTATVGDLLAAVIQFTTTAGNLQLVESLADNLIRGNIVPYIDFNGGGFYAIDDVLPAVAVRMDGDVIPFGAYPGINCPRTNFDSASTPDERGNRFVLDAPMYVRGIGARLARGSVGANTVRLRLYDASDTVIYSRTFDESANSTSQGTCLAYGAETLLAAGAVYRIALEALGSVDCYIDELDAGSAAMLDFWPGGADWYYTSRSDAGTWTDTTTMRAVDFFLIVSGVAGKLLTHPGMAGGMRG